MRTSYCMLGLLAVIAANSDVHAQAVSSAFGSRTLGNGVSTNTQNFSANSGRSTGGVGSPGTGMSGMSPTGSNGSLTQNFSLSSTGTRQGQGQFVGADRMDSTNAISQQAAGQQNAQNNAGQAAFFNQLTQQMRQGQNQLQQLNRAGQGGQGQNRVQLRIPVSVGFTTAPVSNKTTAQLTRRFANLPGLQPTSPIVVRMDGGTAVLTGQVASDSDRELATQIAKMEPGIESVRNELTVGPAGSTAGQLPPARP